MKRIISLLIMLAMVFCLASCGKNEKAKAEEEEYEVAMIVDAEDIEDSAFAKSTWECVSKKATELGLSSKRYKPKESTEEAYLESINKAVENKAEIIIMAGSNFETTANTAQAQYPEVNFLLIDGVPHDAAANYATAANTVCIIFAEEEAGYLAGYAAVKDGYRKIGFMGGAEVPSVKRYGYGFVQGVSAAAAELEKKVELSYTYTGTFEPSDDVQKLAKDWYKDGTQVIFACGGSMGKSVMKAAEKNNGYVIGVDADQSSFSETVITSAMKNIEPALSDMLENYNNGKFVGGTAFNYTAENGGVGLEMKNGRFKKFTDDDYKKVFKQLKNKKIQLKKDTVVGSVNELLGEWVTLK